MHVPLKKAKLCWVPHLGFVKEGPSHHRWTPVTIGLDEKPLQKIDNIMILLMLSLLMS